MCIFCAAVPMSAAIGASIAGKQHAKGEHTAVSSESTTERKLPVGKITVAVTGGLVVCSAVYHLVIVPHTGVLI